MPPAAEKKIIVIGDEGCGKTGLIFSLFAEHIPDPAVPTIYKEYSTEVETEDGARVPVVLWIIPVQEHYSRIRPLSYPGTDAVVLCYAISDPPSLANAEGRWLPEIREHLPGVPVVLCGNKADLRSGEGGGGAVTTEEGRAVADRIRARRFVECSAKNADNVREVFRAATTAATTKAG